MNISISKPPAFIYDECVKLLGIDKRKNVVWTFGSTIFNPDNAEIPDHLYEHELTHANQQKHDDTVAKLWWARYVADPSFRLDQETEAYRAQYKFICEKTKDRNTRYRALHQIATDLSGKMYGNLVSFTEAIRRIRDQS